MHADIYIYIYIYIICMHMHVYMCIYICCIYNSVYIQKCFTSIGDPHAHRGFGVRTDRLGVPFCLALPALG